MPASVTLAVTSTPHDALFRGVFEHTPHAEAELRHVLPAAIVDAIDWRSLTLQPGTYVDDELAKRHSDLLFSATLALSGDPLLVFVLCEHQSSDDALMPVRLLEYMIRIWRRFVAEHPGEPLPPIIPVVVAHAADGWRSPVELADLCTPHLPPSIRATLPNFRYALDDLAHVSDEDLHRRAMQAVPRLALWLMRDVRRAETFLRNLPRWAPTFQAIARSPTHRESALRLLRYVALVCDEVHYDRFRANLQKLAPATEPLNMTIAERLHAEGRAEGKAEGKAEGRAEGKADAILLILEARGLLVDDAVRVRITACHDLPRLEHWLSRAVTVEHAADIFED